VSLFFRLVLVLPHVLLLGLLYFGLLTVQAMATVMAWVTILVAGRFPASLHRFSVGILRWSTRLAGYVLLLTDAYPPFGLDAGDPYPVRLGIAEETHNRNRLTSLFRGFMVVPHLIVLYFLSIAAAVVLVISWFAALFTANVPAGLHGFLEGFLRWNTRVGAYFLLLTDEYPPFSLS
jgi:hypothetical protein